MNEIEGILEQIGLTKSEIATYLALLELGSSSTGKIVDKSRTTSSKIYEVLDKLVQKGLVSHILKGGVKHFEAAPPERILDYMQKKQAKIDSQTQSLKEIIPQLKLKQEMAEVVSSATIYEGMKGLHTAFYDALEKAQAGDELLCMNIPKQSKAVDAFFTGLIKSTVEKKIALKSIFNLDAKEMSENNLKFPTAQVKYTSENTPASINILGDIVIIFPSDNEKLILFVIEDKNTAASFRKQFYQQWNQETTITKGDAALQNMFIEVLEEAKEDKFYRVLGASYGDESTRIKYSKLFAELHAIRQLKGIAPRILFDQGVEQYVKDNGTTLHIEDVEKKFLPYSQDLPVATFITDNKIRLLIQDKEPTVITIDNKKIAKTYKLHFDTTWNQDVTVRKGFDAFKQVLWDIADRTKPGSTQDVLGAGVNSSNNNKEYGDLFKEFSKYRFDKKVPARLLFEQNSKKYVEDNSQNYKHKLSKVKFLPYEVESPVEIFIEDDKAHISIQEEDEPTIITIENKRIAQAFQSQFDSLWNQEVSVFRGIDAVKDVFNDMLLSGHCDFISARGYLFDADPKWTADWSKRAQKSGFTMRNILDSGFKGHPITQLPFAENKYTLQKEFAELSVIWIYGEKVVISNWAQGEPIVITIDNKELHNTYTKQFELLWNQTTQTYYGDDAIQSVLNEALECDATHWIGGNSGVEDFAGKGMKTFFQDWMKRRVTAKKDMYDLVDYGSHLEGLEPNNKASHKNNFYHYQQLPEGLESPMVIILFGNKVAQVFWSENSHVIVHENQAMFDSYMKYFKYFWKK